MMSGMYPTKVSCSICRAVNTCNQTIYKRQYESSPHSAEEFVVMYGCRKLLFLRVRHSHRPVSVASLYVQVNCSLHRSAINAQRRHVSVLIFAGKWL